MPVMVETSRLVGTRRAAVDPRVGVVEIVARAQGHHDFFERAVAGPLADAVDRAFDLPGAVFDARQAVGHGQAQIVVAMHADHRPSIFGTRLLRLRITLPMWAGVA